MKAFVITLAGHAYSEECAERCIRSGREVGGVEIERFAAVTKDNAAELMRWHGLSWTWANGNQSDSVCPVTKLKQRPYGNLQAKMACSMSHFMLWQKCVLGEPLMILEHDAVFVSQFRPFEYMGICQLNDPKGATKRGQWWSEQMEQRGPGVFRKANVLPDDVPDGLAGNSSYILKPFAASDLIAAFHRLGVWPNDATMCRQLFPYLEEAFPFVTKVEQTLSTTSQ